MTATALSDANALITNQELDAAARTLQEITEFAIEDRERRPLLEAELIVPAVTLAQQITEQLHNYGLDQERVDVGEGKDIRRYFIQKVSWKSGSFGRRHRERALVLCFLDDSSRHVLLWDPRNPSGSWDLKDPPGLLFTELQGSWPRNWCADRLANGAELAQWAKDAQPFLDRVRTREHARTQHLRDGIESSEKTLGALGI